jgi:hypothetical protein
MSILLIASSVSLSQTARLQVIHNSADAAADSVDIYLNGSLLLDNFKFRTATPFIDAPAGELLNIGVAAANSTSANDTIKNFQATLTAGEKYVVIANGVLDPSSYSSNPDGKGTGFTLFIKDMARESAMDTSKVEFAVVHGSTDAPSVDVIARGVAALVDNAAYGDITDYIPVPASNYTLDITPANDNNIIVTSLNADLSGLKGGAAVVFASGFLNPSTNQDGSSFGVFAALPNGAVVQFSTLTAVSDLKTYVPSSYNLMQNYPNPFNPSTKIKFSLPAQQFVSLKVYNLLGQEVAALLNKEMTSGNHTVDFRADDLSSGVYFYELKAGSYNQMKKMLLMK